MRRALALMFVLVGIVAAPAAAGTTYNVSTIVGLQAAIDAVNAGPGGDTIVLAPGFYDLFAAGLGGLTIDQDVTIQGDALAPTVLDGGGMGEIFSIQAANVSFVNLTLQNVSTAIEYEGSGVLSVTGLTITGSQTTAFDAGDSGGAVFFTNSTIAGNPGHGSSVSCGELHMTNVTATGNGVGLYFGFPCGEQMTVTNSLIVGNTQDCGGGGSFAFVADASIDSDATCAAFTLAPRGNGTGFATNGAPQVGSLAANGGPTMTEAIAATSPAVNSGDNTGCPATDQRGFLRTDGACDIGAYEAGAVGAGGGNTQPGSNVAVSPAPGVTLTFTSVLTAGDTSATTGGPAPPTGFRIDGVVYDIATTATFSGLVQVCLPYSPTDANPALYHYEVVPPATTPSWTDRTTSVDSANHVVCGSVSSLSPFAVLMRIDVAGQLQQLQSLIDSFNLRKPAARRFTHRLDDARRALNKRKHSTKHFCEELGEFIRDVRRQTGRSLTTAEASQLLALATQIALEVGCRV